MTPTTEAGTALEHWLDTFPKDATATFTSGQIKAVIAATRIEARTRALDEALAAVEGLHHSATHEYADGYNVAIQTALRVIRALGKLERDE